jgi:orotidine-5'-phosphate decarboxylase
MPEPPHGRAVPGEPRDRLIVALDLPTAAEARRIVQALGDSVSTYKVGKELFTREGPQLVRELVGGGRRVFLDLKFHDIPNTVAGAVRAAAGLGAHMLTVHACGGAAMLRAAVGAAAESPSPPLVLAVTVLTSLGDSDLAAVGVGGSARQQVLRLAALARECGCGGVVASPQEAAELRRGLGAGFVIVTPGVRSAEPAAGGRAAGGMLEPAAGGRAAGGIKNDDQARVATPAAALAAGADYLVVGRPITQAADPAAAALAILRQMAQAAAPST